MWRPSPKAWLSHYYLSYFFSYGVYIPFWALWLKGIGISAPNIGMLLGLSFAVRCVSNLIFPPKIHKMTQLIPALRLITVITIAFFLSYFLATESFLALVIVTILFNLAIGPAIPISDTLGNYYSRINQLDYGQTRLWGSLAFMAGSTVAGVIADHMGYISIPYVLLVGLVVGILAVFRNPSVVPLDEEGGHTSSKVRLIPLLKNRKIWVFLGVTALIQGSHAGYYNFSALYWSELGFSESSISIFWSLGIVGEVCIFAIAKRLFAGWDFNRMLHLAALGVIVRWATLALATNVICIGAAQLLHGITYACAHLAAIGYIQSVSSRYMVSLQSIYNALTMSAFMALVSMICGWTYSIQPNYVFGLMALMGIPALFIKLDKLQLD